MFFRVSFHFPLQVWRSLVKSLLPGDRMRGNGSKLHRGRFKLGIRKHFFTERVVKPWNRLPKRGGQ